MSPSDINCLNNLSSVDPVFPHKCSFTLEKTKQQITKVSDLLKCTDCAFNVSGWLRLQGEVREQGFCLQSVMDALLTDDSASRSVSINKVESTLHYKSIAMKLHHFNRLMLSAQRFTEIDHVIHLMLQKLRHLVLFIGPVILMSTHIPYVIIHYVKKKKLITPAGAILATCSACSMKLLLKKRWD